MFFLARLGKFCKLILFYFFKPCYNFIFTRNLFIYLLIHLFNLFILFIRYLSEIYSSKIYQVIFLRIFYILSFINKILLNSISYIVYGKEQSKIRGKSRKKIGREYGQISQIIKRSVIHNFV